MDIPVLELAERMPVATGKTRWVFEHPGDPGKLIKVHRVRADLAQSSLWQRWQDRFLYRTGILRELAVFVDSRYGSRHSIVDHIAPIHGVVDTDLGLGFVVAAVRDAEGRLAPTVHALRKGEAGKTKGQEHGGGGAERESHGSRFLGTKGTGRFLPTRGSPLSAARGAEVAGGRR